MNTRVSADHGTIDGLPIMIIQDRDFKAWTEGAWTYAWGATPGAAAAKLKARRAAESARTRSVEPGKVEQ